ncbi:oxepin-CoA hydrolase/3-oxo-5,6-dehydrosuberyl-CoA semialdehyde dehydrogenase [Flavobacterium branchiophilum]|uniref:Oxepin-CoA hydrolase/3-oxo-5,6-dehydrosuberyl-CoA semialdehyde dehydrogenase n=2 Tax=Flavobacterium branchiophilum TaxID=55197 RepID=A0A543G7E6_9FLAO|nr:oxepin-CoA hydrolase/3-oxo-5,6-dehydrosuberyl-CoA semialdehyde dehydrogenase [Flavobacterium branchiophilum]
MVQKYINMINHTQHYVQGKWVVASGEGIPTFDAITGEYVATTSVEGLDIPSILQYGRTKGGEKLRKMTFQERGNMLKSLAIYLTKKKEIFYELSYKTGATRTDSWIDIEGGFGNLYANASLRKLFPNLPYHVEGDPIDLSKGGRFMAHHLLVPKKGVAIHINAFNFPIWGMLEKCAVNWMAGMPAVVLPAPVTAYLTEAVVKEIIASNIIPEGALQLISGTVTNIFDTVESQDVVTFTGSAATGRILKSHPRIIQEAVPFTLEADSLNASILGEDALPGTPEFQLFIQQARSEITVKAGQKCTAIRRLIIPENVIDEVQNALSKALDQVNIGNPRLKEVRMGALVSKKQVEVLLSRIQELSQSADIVYGNLQQINLMGANEKGAFVSPTLLRENQPFNNAAAHEIEAFGPVATLMPYQNLEQAITLAQMGKGSLVSSIVTYSDKIAKDYVINAASHHGRILVLNRENAKQSTGHGSPLPLLVHGGPGRAGGGQEMGGVRGIKHYMQRCAIQGSPTTLTEITEIYQPKSAYKPITQHPFQYHWEDIQPGMSLQTHNRTVTDTDIINFSNLTWDHFYAHTDITALEGSIFKKRTAHGYFILAAAAGLFVYPNKGPVAANYGLEECRFLKPIYHNDTIYVRLICKQKIDRDVVAAEHPSGIVKWFVEVFDMQNELVAVATILTMVQKKQTVFVEMTHEKIQECLNKLTENTQPKWGSMTAQHMIEHLEFGYKIAAGIIQNFELITPNHILEKVHHTLYNYNKMPQNFDFPLAHLSQIETVKHANLDEAKHHFWEARAAYLQFFETHPNILLKNAVFGNMNRYEWYLLDRKHLNHHFEQFDIL